MYHTNKKELFSCAFFEDYATALRHKQEVFKKPVWSRSPRKQGANALGLYNYWDIANKPRIAVGREYSQDLQKYIIYIMKKFLLILYILPIFLYSQKYDNVWFMGGDSGNGHGNGKLDFSTYPPIIDSILLPIYLQRTTYTMCDSLGNLAFCSNGFRIANKLNALIDNGIIVDADTALNFDFQPQYQSSICLPQPNSNHLFYQLDIFYDFYDPNGVFGKQLRYSTIDIQANNGLGKVIAKNIPLIQDTLAYWALTAVKHGNGKDWWIIIPESNSRSFYRILLDETGFSSPIKQNINPNLCAKHVGGLAIFSPDGNQYIYDNIEGTTELQIYNFDRCTGELTFREVIPIPYRQYEWSLGLAVSPNSQFLYCSFSDTLFQFNLGASVVANTQTVVATGIQGNFSQMQLAPDGKVYVDITNNNTTQSNFHYMGIINNPNNQGIACNYVDKQIRLAPYNLTPPHYPNYRLEALHNPCAVGVESPQEGNIAVYPNPASDKIHIQGLKSVYFTLYDLSGKKIKEKSLTLSKEIPIADLVEGIYFYEIITQNHARQYGKLIISFGTF